MKEKLNQFHITILIYMTQVGIGLLSLPSTLAAYFGTNGWLGLFLVFGITCLNIFLIHFVYRLGNGKSVLEILESAIPKFLLTPVYLACAVVWSFIGCMVIQEYVLLLQMISFPTTPTYILKLLIDFFVLLIVLKGIYVIGKTSTAFFYLTIWLVFLEVFVLKEFEFARFTPFLFKGGTDFMKGLLSTYFSFLGYELSIFLFPYVEKNRKFTRAVLTGNFFSFILYLSVALIAFGFFSFQELRNQMYPILDLFSYIRLPFIERIENLLFGFLLYLMVSTAAMYFWAALEVSQRIVPRLKRNVIGFVLMAASFAVAMQIDVLSDVKKFSALFSTIQIGIAFGLPTLLLIILLIKRRSRLHV